MRKDLKVGSELRVDVRGIPKNATIERIGASQGKFHMLTLVIDGEPKSYAVAHESEISIHG